ncbi:hypothetical protein VTK56DRAFT_6750 [Thermocarpiscus australiensis]
MPASVGTMEVIHDDDTGNKCVDDCENIHRFSLRTMVKKLMMLIVVLASVDGFCCLTSAIFDGSSFLQAEACG